MESLQQKLEHGMETNLDTHILIWYDWFMSKRVKKIYKCVECETMITIVTKVHELPESIICPCDKIAENQGSK
jgi:hypothetical protein